MTIRQAGRAFLDTNILIMAFMFRDDDVFDWINRLYGDVWIHQDVLDELLLHQRVIQEKIVEKGWQLFDAKQLCHDELSIYNSYISEIKSAFRRLREAAVQAGRLAKNTADTGEITTLAVCLLQDAQIICSQDTDVANIIEAETYCYIDADGQDHLIIHDSAQDFCYYCYQEAGIQRAKVRKFYKSFFSETATRTRRLAELDARLSA